MTLSQTALPPRSAHHASATWSGRLALAALLAALLTATGAAATTVPSFEDVSGHAFGDRITQHHEMASYLEALAATSPRVKVKHLGQSWEHRDLLLAVVTSEANHQRLEAIRQTSLRLADPRLGSDGVPEDQPAVVWLGGSIHGFELSGTEGLLKLLERLTTQDDEATRRVLDETVVLIDPMINPDGRDAFAQFNHRQMGATPNPLREDWNNRFTSWQALQYRTGHYFFDTNRDWFAQTQRETQARVATFMHWRPQVIVDAHEMGPDVEFYFDPPTEPYGTYFPSFAKTWFGHFGDAYADAFDGRGFAYTQGEMFNYYYPGYTTSFGSYLGAVGMLYEQGSSRGLSLERSDGSVRTLADALEQQYTAAWTAVRLSAERRTELLNDYWNAKQQALDDDGAVRRYLLPSGQGSGDAPLLGELETMLRRNGVEVGRLTEETQLSGVRDRFGRDVGKVTFPIGTRVVEVAQPASPLVRTLLEPHLDLPTEFLEAARKRLDRGENPRFYDITAWSLPLLFNVEGHSSTDPRPLKLDLEPSAATSSALPKAAYAYVFDGRAVASMAVLNQLRQDGIRASVLTQGTRLDGHDIPRGSVVVRARQRGEHDPETIHRRVETLRDRFGVSVWATGSGRGDEAGPTLGQSESIAPLPVDVALLAQGGVHGYSFGYSWYTLEEHYGINTTVLPAEHLANTPLHRFETLVIPDLMSSRGLAETLGEDGIDRLKGWVHDGGNLVVLGNAVDLARQQLGLLSLRSWYEVSKPEGGKEGSGEKGPARRFMVPGAMVAAELDMDSWLSAGYEDAELPFLLFSERLYLPPSRPAQRRPSPGIDGGRGRSRHVRAPVARNQGTAAGGPDGVQPARGQRPRHRLCRRCQLPRLLARHRSTLPQRHLVGANGVLSSSIRFLALLTS